MTEIPNDAHDFDGVLRIGVTEGAAERVVPQNRAAMASLITATSGDPARSTSLNSRPCTSGSSSIRK